MYDMVKQWRCHKFFFSKIYIESFLFIYNKSKKEDMKGVILHTHTLTTPLDQNMPNSTYMYQLF